MDIEKLFKEFVEKEWHDGHEPQGGHDHYEEEEVELDEDMTDIYGFKNFPKRNKVGDEIEKIASKGGTDKFNLSKIASELQKGRIPHKFIKKLSPKGKKAVHDIMKDFGWKKLPEDKEVEESWKPIEEAFWKVNIPDMPPVFIEAGSASEIKSDMRKKLKGEVFKELGVERVSKTEMIKKYRSLAKGGDDKDFDTAEARSYIDRKKKEKEKKDYKKKYGREPFSFSNKHMSQKHSMGIAAEFVPELDEGYKDLPPHLQKLIKKIEKKQQDWNKKYPNAKIKTLVYNPDTGKPDIEVKENTMKLEDTVKSVLEGKLPPALQKAIDKKKGKKDDSEKDDPEVKKEDTNKEKPGTQGDMKKYQAARAKVMKKFGVKSCSELEGDKKKACYAALDAAHVSDEEEEDGEKKEQRSFSKMFSHLKSMMKEKKKKGNPHY